jgi:integrase
VSFDVSPSDNTVSGRLGLRAGEIAHFDVGWLDEDRCLIHIPQHSPCRCGYCRRQAAQQAERQDCTTEESLARRWRPKTPTSARAIPFDLSLRLELCVDRFTTRFEEFPRSRSTINRRVTAAARAADLEGHIYPHGLRATAASYHAYHGVAPVPLQAMMGWRDLTTAQKYIRISGTATANALRDVHR